MSDPKAPQARAMAWRSALLALAVAALPSISQAAVQAQIDSTTVAANEPLTLSIVSDAPGAGAQPDLSALRQDFSVLGTEQSTETSIFNGSRSDRVRWTVHLLPLHAGSIRIPAIPVGTERTAAIDLTVTKPSAAAQAEASGHAFLEVQTAPSGQSTFVQQSIPYTVRLFVDDTVRSGELVGPEAPDAAVEQIGQDKRYTASRQGRDYSVIERRYVISPQKSGSLKLAPARFQGTAIVPASPAAGGAGDDDPAAALMDRMLRNTPFANDPMFRNGLTAGFGAFQQTRPLAAQAPQLELDVKPRPAGTAGAWLPAQAVTLHDSWQDAPPQLHVGEPVTRVITIEASGVSGSQIPTLTPAAPANARVYPESVDNQTHLDGQAVTGISKQTVTYIPGATGALQVPALELAWWDTRAQASRSATLPAMRFDVAPGAGGATSTQPAPQPAAGSTRSAAATSASTPTALDDLSPAKALQWMQGLATGWRWLAAGIALATLAALAALAAWLVRRRHARPARIEPSTSNLAPTPAASSPTLPGRKATLQALRTACDAGDRDAASRALLDLGRIQWPDDPPRGLRALAQRLESGAAEILALDRSLYGNASQPWDGAALRNAVGDGLRPAPTGEPPRGHGLGLEALYGGPAARG